jgi:GNAT superfamily N-acetyltransferase
VAKEWRGRGIGGRLFKAIEQHYTAVFEAQAYSRPLFGSS